MIHTKVSVSRQLLGHSPNIMAACPAFTSFNPQRNEMILYQLAILFVQPLHAICWTPNKTTFFTLTPIRWLRIEFQIYKVKVFEPSNLNLRAFQAGLSKTNDLKHFSGAD